MEVEGDDSVACVDVLPDANGSDEPTETVEREA
jgi:hypothetical protein